MSTPGARVVIVDDDPSFLGIVAELLRDRGHEVDPVNEPGQALNRVESGAYDVALLDLIMPGMGGFELGDRIRSLSPDTEVIILTGYADLQTALEGIHYRVFDYIDKSQLDGARLDRSVRDAAERARLARSNRELRLHLQHTNRRLKALLGVSSRLAGEAHQDRVLDALARAASEIVETGGSRALLFGRRVGGGWVIEAAAGDGAGELVGVRLQAGEGLAIVSVETDRPVASVRPAEEASYSSRCDAFEAATPAAYLAVPVRHGGIYGALIVWRLAGGPFTSDEQDLVAALGHQGAIALSNAAAHERSVNFFTHVSEMLVSFLDSLDIFYQGHSRRTSALADMVTRRLGLPDGERRTVHFAALLHDIGKVLIDPIVLRSPDHVGESEVKSMRRHPEQGAELLRPITAWEDILPLIHSHHERWDGKGYPAGLSGDDIPLGARIISVVEAFDVMTHERPHGRHRTPEEGLAELEACAGTQFDARIVRLFVSEYRARRDEIPPA